MKSIVLLRKSLVSYCLFFLVLTLLSLKENLPILASEFLSQISWNEESNVCSLKSDKSVKQPWCQISFSGRQMNTLCWMKKLLCPIAQKTFALLRLFHVLRLICSHPFTVLFYLCNPAQILLRGFLFHLSVLLSWEVF